MYKIKTAIANVRLNRDLDRKAIILLQDVVTFAKQSIVSGNISTVSPRLTADVWVLENVYVSFDIGLIPCIKQTNGL